MVVLHSKQVQRRLLGAGVPKVLRNTITIKMVMGIVFFFAGMSIVNMKQHVGLSLAGAGLILVFVPAEFLFGICIDFKGQKKSRPRSDSAKSQGRLSQVSVKVDDDDNSGETTSSPDIRTEPQRDGTPPSRRISLASNLSQQALPGSARRESSTAYQATRFHRARSAVLRYEQDSRQDTSPATSSATSSPTRSPSSRGEPANPRRFHRTRSAVLQSSDFRRASGQSDAAVSRSEPDDTRAATRGGSISSKRQRFQRTRSVDVSEDAEERTGVPSTGAPQKTVFKDRGSLGKLDGSPTTSPRTTVRLQESEGRNSDTEACRRWSQTSWSTENYTRFHRIRAAMQAAEVQKARAARAKRPELQKSGSLTSSSVAGSSRQLRTTTTIKYETTTTTTVTVTGSRSRKEVTGRPSSDISSMSPGKATDLRRTSSGPSGRPARGSCPGAALPGSPAPPWASMAIQTAGGIVTLLCEEAGSSSTSSTSAQGSTESESKSEDCDRDKAVHCGGVVQPGVECTSGLADNTGCDAKVRKGPDSWPDSDNQNSASVGQVSHLRQRSGDASDTG